VPVVRNTFGFTSAMICPQHRLDRQRHAAVGEAHRVFVHVELGLVEEHAPPVDVREEVAAQAVRFA
jgi:hypothetical protein